MEQGMARQADEAAIREQAYYFWEQDGRPHGRETEYWMRATVALSEKAQLDTLTEPVPKAAKPGRLKAAASKAKDAPAKKEPSKAKPQKPKKK
jgi:hypothetical protein